MDRGGSQRDLLAQLFSGAEVTARVSGFLSVLRTLPRDVSVLDKLASLG